MPDRESKRLPDTSVELAALGVAAIPERGYANSGRESE